MELPDYVRLLRDAARASALSWAEPMDQTGLDRAVRHLAIALRDLQIVVTRLAGLFRLVAIVRPEPARVARSEAVTTSVQALAKAWLILEDVVPSEAAPCRTCVPADLLCFAAKRAASWRRPWTGPDEIARYLAETLTALEDGTCHLAAHAAPPLAARLTATGDCLRAAWSQLGHVRQGHRRRA
jgi:hypothetical protein